MGVSWRELNLQLLRNFLLEGDEGVIKDDIGKQTLKRDKAVVSGHPLVEDMKLKVSFNHAIIRWIKCLVGDFYGRAYENFLNSQALVVCRECWVGASYLLHTSRSRAASLIDLGRCSPNIEQRGYSVIGIGIGIVVGNAHDSGFKQLISLQPSVRLGALVCVT